MEFFSSQSAIALLQIIGVNIVLSGDNAVVIALAARSLPPRQQRQAVLWGSGAAVAMRIVLTVVAVELLRLPYLKLIGAGLLLWIGIKLLAPEEEHGGAGAANIGMAAAIRTILLADLVMSLDNVIAVAAAAKGSLALLVIGLLISIPLVIFGSTLLMRFMERFPIIVTIGAALLGWVAGEMAATDPFADEWIKANAGWLRFGLPIAGAACVVAVGKWLAARKEAREERAPVLDLAAAGDQPATAAAGATADTSKLRILLAADGSDSSNRAIDRWLPQLAWFRRPVEVHLLNAQRPLHGDVSAFVDEDQRKQFHHEEGLKALAPARERLERAGVDHVIHIGLGNPAHVITHYARDMHCDQIVMGTRGYGVAGVALGSVATPVIQSADVPVLLVK